MNCADLMEGTKVPLDVFSYQVFDLRPNYFAVLLWNRLMGTTVYDTAEPIREGVHVYAQSRKDKEGVVYLVINNSRTESTEVELPKDAEVYELAGLDGNIRATVMTCNGSLFCEIYYGILYHRHSGGNQH